MSIIADCARLRCQRKPFEYFLSKASIKGSTQFKKHFISMKYLLYSFTWLKLADALEFLLNFNTNLLDLQMQLCLQRAYYTCKDEHNHKTTVPLLSYKTRIPSIENNLFDFNRKVSFKNQKPLLA